MEAFVLDASVAVSWCFPHDLSENTAYSQAILDLLADANAVVPEIWPFEIANNIFVAFAIRKRITESQINEYVALLGSLPIRVERGELMATIALEAIARKHGLAAYDVAYLDLARRLKLPLATSDQALKKAALTEGVQLV